MDGACSSKEVRAVSEADMAATWPSSRRRRLTLVSARASPSASSTAPMERLPAIGLGLGRRRDNLGAGNGSAGVTVDSWLLEHPKVYPYTAHSAI